jgi:hypothetical protein
LVVVSEPLLRWTFLPIDQRLTANDRFLSLTLLVLRVFADDAHHTVAVDHLALIANLLYGGPYFHNSFQFSVFSSQ